jgi:allantoin racemase
MKPSVLVINPNTSERVTALLQAELSAVLPQCEVHAVTARFGAPYICDEASYAVACHAVLDAWAAWQAQGAAAPQSVLVGCFGDPGLPALRQCCPARVTGLAEAAFTEARQRARTGRFAVVTTGQRWIPMIERLALALGFGDAWAGVAALDAGEPAAQAARACRRIAQRGDIEAIVVGGAALAGLAARIQPDFAIPLIDSVAAGARQALQAPQGEGSWGSYEWRGVAPELSAAGAP